MCGRTIESGLAHSPELKPRTGLGVGQLLDAAFFPRRSIRRRLPPRTPRQTGSRPRSPTNRPGNIASNLPAPKPSYLAEIEALLRVGGRVHWQPSTFGV